MLNLSKESKDFLQKNIPEALKVNNVNEVLDALYNWIDLNGFADDGLYNKQGEAAQKVYDDLYSNND